MAEIRALERADLPTVVALLRDHLPGWALSEDVLAATVLEHPWSDDELPSLVAVDEIGSVIGFIGSQARRMRFDDRLIRGVCCTQLVVAPHARAGAPGALLLGRLLAGPQDVTWSDSATDPVVRVWQTFGGHPDHARAAEFMLVLRPGRWLRSIAAASVRRQHVGRALVPVGAFPLAAAGKWLTHRDAVAKTPGVEGEDASATVIAEHIPTLASRLRVRVDWDRLQLDHMFEQVEAIQGPLVRRLVRRGGRPIGWYAYLARPGGVSRLLHLAASDRATDAVLEELIDHATAVGTAVLAGRAEPHLERPLRHRFAALGFARQPMIRARDPELAAILATSTSLLTRLGGEVFAR